MTLYILFKVGIGSQTVGVFDDLERAKSHVNIADWHIEMSGNHIARIDRSEFYKIETHELNHVSIPD